MVSGARLCPVSSRRWLRFFSSSGRLETENAIIEAAKIKQTGVTLQELLNFGNPGGSSAQFLRHELPIRFAHRIVELDHLPLGLALMPSVRTIRDWYRISFEEIRSFPAVTCDANVAAFNNLLRSIFERHNATIVTMARGIFEFRKSLGVAHGEPLPLGFRDGTQLWRMLCREMACSSALSAFSTGIHHYLDVFFSSRVGIRTLIAQQLAVHEPPVRDFVGIVHTKCCPRQ